MKEHGLGQYIIKDKNRILDVNEIESILNYEDIIDLDIDGVYKVISGSIIPNLGVSKQAIIDDLKEKNNSKIGLIENDKCLLGTILDIHIGEDKYNYKIPFSALIKSNLRIKENDKFCKTIFIREYKNIKEDINKRKYLFAVKKESNIEEKEIEFWKNKIPEKLLYISRSTW